MGGLRQFLSFSGIGVLNTAIHLAVAIGLVELLAVHPVAANTLAFLVANSFSYVANSLWSFRAELGWARFFRFFAVSVAGLLLTIGLSSLAVYMRWHYLVGVALVVCLLPVLSFASHKFWTFTPRD